MRLFARIPHQLYYVAELFVLIVGFFSIYLLSFSFNLQKITLSIVLLFYVLMGSLHHALHHNLRVKIVVEYILVSILIFAVFLFLNAGKL